MRGRWLIILGLGMLGFLAGCGATSPTSDGAAASPCATFTSGASTQEEQRQIIRRAIGSAWEAQSGKRGIDSPGIGVTGPEEELPPSDDLEQATGQVHSAYQQLFCAADGDGDGRLTRAEVEAADALQVFQQSEQWAAVLHQYLASSEELSPSRFVSFMMDLLQRTSSQQQSNPLLQSQAVRLPGRGIPTLLVQGYGEPNWYFMSGIYLHLRHKNLPVFAINLFPNMSDIGKQAYRLKYKIDEILRQTHSQHINLVGHSMGGLISRYYIQNLGGVNMVDNLITIATPHYGTYVAKIGIRQGARQMEPGSQFLRELNARGGIYPPVHYTSIWTPTDEIVIPASSAQLLGSEMMPPVTGTGHLLVLFDRRTYKYIWSAVGRDS